MLCHFQTHNVCYYWDENYIKMCFFSFKADGFFMIFF